jgi:hypothetical protein
MNMPNDNDTITHQARSWSQRLGNLAAASSAIRPQAAFPQLGAITAPPTRLSSILDHFRQRARRREHAADKLRAQEFMTGQ